MAWYVSGTSVWYLGGVDPATTIAFFFEVTNTNATPLPPHKRRYTQFLTSYQAATGRFRLRVTTVCGLWHSDPADHQPIAQSFDQVRYWQYSYRYIERNVILGIRKLGRC